MRVQCTVFRREGEANRLFFFLLSNRPTDLRGEKEERASPTDGKD